MVTTTRTKKRVRTNYVDLARVLVDVIKEGDEDVDRNKEVAAERLGLSPLSFDQKLRNFRQTRPQARLLDLERYFLKPRGLKKNPETEDKEINTILSTVLGIDVEEIEERVAEIREEMEEEKEKKEEEKEQEVVAEKN